MKLIIKDAVLYDEEKAKEYLEDWLKLCPIEVSLEAEEKLSKDMLTLLIAILEKQEAEYTYQTTMQHSVVPSYNRVLLREAIKKFKEEKENAE